MHIEGINRNEKWEWESQIISQHIDWCGYIVQANATKLCENKGGFVIVFFVFPKTRKSSCWLASNNIN